MKHFFLNPGGRKSEFTKNKFIKNLQIKTLQWRAWSTDVKAKIPTKCQGVRISPIETSSLNSTVTRTIAGVVRPLQD